MTLAGARIVLSYLASPVLLDVFPFSEVTNGPSISDRSDASMSQSASEQVIERALRGSRPGLLLEILVSVAGQRLTLFHEPVFSESEEDAILNDLPRDSAPTRMAGQSVDGTSLATRSDDVDKVLDGAGLLRDSISPSLVDDVFRRIEDAAGIFRQ